MIETKTSSGFSYIEVAQENPWGFARNKIMDSKGFKQEFSKNGQTDLYYSYMLFGEELVEYVNKNGSVAGFPGPALPRGVVVDFDAEQEEGGIVSNEALEQARHDALSYIYRAAEEFGFPAGYFRICFSGCKGFSLELPRQVFGGFVPSSSAHKEVGHLVRALSPTPEPLSTLDLKIYDVNTRLWRVPKTINSKSGLYKVPLTLEELEDCSVAKIKELATKKQEVELLTVEPVEKLIELYDRARAETSASNLSGGPRKRAREKAANGGATYKSGERNTRLTRAAGWFRRDGHDEQAILAVLEALNDTLCDEPLPKQEIQNIARSIARYDPEGDLPPDAEIEWGDPEPLPTLPPVPPFDFELLPEAFKEWVKDVSERMQVAPDFVAVAAMIVTATIVGRKLGIRPKKRDDWLVVLNLWGFVVGKPASLKSPALEEARMFLKKLDEKAEEDFRAAEMEYKMEQAIAEAEQEALEKHKKKLVKQVAENEDEGKKDELRSSLEEKVLEAEEAPKPEPPTRRRYWTSDATTEKIAELLVENPNGLLAYRDELAGWFQTLGKTGREGDRQFYLESWNGNNSYQVDRIGRGSFYIPALCLSMLGSIQTGVLSAYVSSACGGGLDADGLLQRFQLAVWPDAPSDYEYVDRKPNEEARTSAYDAFKALAKMEGSVDDEDGFIRFSDEAQPIFVEWFTNLNQRINTEPMLEVFEAHLGKYRSLMPSLALLIELVDSGGEAQSVGEEATKKAKSWMEYLEQYARRIYFSAEHRSVLSEELMDHIQEGEIDHGSTIRDIYRKKWSRLGTTEEVKEALAVLEEYDWVVVHKKKAKGGGRPTERVLLHPALRKE